MNPLKTIDEPVISPSKPPNKMKRSSPTRNGKSPSKTNSQLNMRLSPTKDLGRNDTNLLFGNSLVLNESDELSLEGIAGLVSINKDGNYEENFNTLPVQSNSPIYEREFDEQEGFHDSPFTRQPNSKM
jgi:hypothetical protein